MPQNSLKLHTPFLKGGPFDNFKKGGPRRLPHLPHPISTTEEGDLVLLVDENTPREQWSKALVMEVLLYKTGLVRQVRVRMVDGAVLIRDIRKICLLEGKVGWPERLI